MGESNSYDVIVVGGGVAGLTSAAYLSRQGSRSILFEKSSKLGGLINTFQVNGFSFDGGARAFENSGIVYPMLRELGIHLDVVSSPVSIIVANERIAFSKKEDVNAYQALLISLFPQNKSEIEAIIARIKDVMDYLDVLYGIDNPLFMEIGEDKQYLLKTLLPWLLRYQINMQKVRKFTAPINDYLRQLTDNTALIDIITQHFFQNTPAFFALGYFGLYLDYSYPIGGTSKLIDGLVGYVQAHGGELRTNTGIARIDLRNKQVTSYSGETYTYKQLIWAANGKALYEGIDLQDMEDRKTQAKIADQQELVHTARGSDSVLTLFVGADLAPEYFAERCTAHTFLTPSIAGLSVLGLHTWEKIAASSLDKNTERGALEAWIKQYLALTTYEISIPALRDVRMAPAGQTGLIVSTLFDYALVKHIEEQGWYEGFKTMCTDEIIAILDAANFPGLQAHVVETLTSTPLSLEKLTGNTGGAISGWEINAGKMPSTTGFTNMTKTYRTPIPDVYQAGQWSFSPSGVPIAILTGKLAAQASIKAIQKKKL